MGEMRSEIGETMPAGPNEERWGEVKGRVRKIGPGEDSDSPRRAATCIREDREESRKVGTHERRET